MWDSNGTISTGNTSRTVSRSAVWTCAASVIVLMEPATGTPATGDFSSSVGAVEADAEGIGGHQGGGAAVGEDEE